MKQKINYTELLKEIVILTGAMAVISAAVYFFLVPSKTSVSSISGLGIILSNFVPLPLSTITMIMNVMLLIIGFLTCGKEFGVKTIYTSIMLPVLNKYLHMELGKAISLSGMCIALSAALVYDKKSVVLSVLGTYFNGLLLDHFIFGQNIKRRVCIITKHEKELRDFILHNLHSGATIYEAVGAYNMEKRNEIITIVDKGEYQKLMDYMNHKDPEAFITVYTVSDLRYRPKV